MLQAVSRMLFATCSLNSRLLGRVREISSESPFFVAGEGCRLCFEGAPVHFSTDMAPHLSPLHPVCNQQHVKYVQHSVRGSSDWISVRSAQDTDHGGCIWGEDSGVCLVTRCLFRTATPVSLCGSPLKRGAWIRRRPSQPSVLQVQAKNSFYGKNAGKNVPMRSFPCWKDGEQLHVVKEMVQQVAMRIVFKTHLGLLKWASLVLLFVGRACAGWPATSAEELCKMYIKPVGVLLIMLYTTLSASAGVYMEWLYKRDDGKSESIHVCNARIYSVGCLFCCVYTCSARSLT